MILLKIINLVKKMIKAFTGKTGSGKTFLMVEEAFYWWKKGTNVYSNTKLDYESQIKRMFIPRLKGIVKKNPNYGKITYFENINEIIDVTDGIIIFDEAQVLFNARLWESLPEEFQYKLQQHRKHNLDLYCTTQNMMSIDITYRRLIHEWIHCKNIFDLGKSPRIIIGVFKKEYKDVDYLYASVDDLQTPTIKTKFFLIHFFSKTLYDTMYDIGFRKFKTIWLSNSREKYYLIIPKKMTIKQALTEIKMLKTLKKVL